MSQNFFKIDTKVVKTSGIVQVFPSFQVISNSNLMTKGKSFYALWDENDKIWTKNEFELIRLVDSEIDKYIASHDFTYFGTKFDPKAMYLSDFSSNVWTQYNKYVKLMPDNFRPLDQKVVFADEVCRKTDYVSCKLKYNREEGPAESYNKLIDKLYDPEQKEKIEWAIGSIFAGDSTKIQKMIVLKGKGGTGKSTVLEIIDKLFEGHTGTFDAKDLISGTNQFAGDAFADNPLVGINEDANLSNVRDNSVLNTVISHGKMIINEKFKSKYELRPGTFLFIATNNDVKITDANSGLIRRIIDVNPTENLHDPDTYEQLMRNILGNVNNELGQIADQCIKTYERLGKNYYNKYLPLSMMYNTNHLYNFVEEHYLEYKKAEYISLTSAYNDYKNYCESNGITHPFSKHEFRREIAAYFEKYIDKLRIDDGSTVRNYFEGFKTEMFESYIGVKVSKDKASWINMTNQKSILDNLLKDMPAQLQDNHKSRPLFKWSNCKTKLSDIDTTKIHYVKVPSNHIVIDFDIKGDNGKKSEKLNKEAAKKFPETYAEMSKSGEGIHLHYFYDGDPELLDRLYDDNIEVKVFTGDSSLRRKLSKCNNLPIAHLKEGDLPLKEKKVLKTEGFESIDKTRNVLLKSLRQKGNTGATATEVSLIKKILDDAYDSGVSYDFRSFKPEVIFFAKSSTNQAEECLSMVTKMHFCSKDVEEDDFVDLNSKEYEEAPLAFYDVEVLSNLFVICWKVYGSKNVNKMINPTYKQVDDLFCKNRYRWVGFNNRDYDNHIVKHWANCVKTHHKLTNFGLYDISRRIINLKDQEAKLMDAYGLSYADIYDYAKKKQSLKKWEIELGIHHQELGLPWDQPVPEELWPKVADYCANDVDATEAVWDATQGDFTARKILAKIAGGVPNDSTNKLSAKFIFEGEKHPQGEFNYRFMGAPEPGHTYTIEDDGITAWQDDGKPIFLGYEYKFGKSSYLDVPLVGEGGYVFAETGNSNLKPDQAGGMYYNVWTFDVSGEHPASIVAENLFGDYYTARFKEILDLRLAIKHGDFDKARQMFGGQLAEYFDDPEMADALSGALKLIVNSAYGLTASSKYETAFRDKRNIDNLVAKRGSLFMINLRYLVQKMGYTVVHCKTDSIKVVDPDQKIYDFIMDYGKKFGYTFEIEHKFEKICLVNNAVYIAKLSKDDPDWIKACKKAAEKGEPEPTRWTATGTQFAVPYVFKTLFSHEPITFDDMCETKNVKVGEIYLDFNETLPDVSYYEMLKETKRKLETNKQTTKKAANQLTEEGNPSYEELDAKIAEGHDYYFVGRVGLFCPVYDGTGGGLMYRYDGDKYNAVTGTSGYRWKEAEIIKANGLESTIDDSYYKSLANDAIDSISQFGDYEWFVS